MFLQGIKLMSSIILSAVVLALVTFRTVKVFTQSKPYRRMPDCAAVFNNDEIAINKSKQWTPSVHWTEHQLVRLTLDCQRLKREFNFKTRPLSAEESDFPLAYAAIVYNHPEQMVRMLSSLYWPQNLYCITYDTKASDAFKKILHNLGKCFNNIILPSQHLYIVWGEFGALEAAVNCLRALHQTDHGWKYVQVISGHTLPLKTNREMVKIFTIFDGANDVEMLPAHEIRIRMKHDRPPGNITVIKGSFATAFSRQFVAFMVKNGVAQEYFMWLNGTANPDESYWPTLVHNDHLNPPGDFPRRCLPVYEKQGKRKIFISRFQIWPNEGFECKGKMFRGSCILGVGDLPTMSQQPHLVAHKIYIDSEPATLHCLVELIHNRTYGLGEKQKEINFEYYQQLPAVQYHKIKNKTAFDCPMGMQHY